MPATETKRARTGIQTREADAFRRLIAATLLAVALTGEVAGQGTPPRKPEGEALLLEEIPSVFGASRFDQAISEAPASVSVITAEDIATHGWRTMGDLLRTVRGFYATNDRTYTYVGARGFARAGDYNQRVLLLVDGLRINENIYDGAYLGLESAVDLATVDRVEIIRGPSSSLYGANAFFGIINVVTLRGRTAGGVRVTGDVGSFGTRDVSVAGGGRARNGIEFVGSVGSRRIAGQDLYFAEFDDPATNRGVSTGRDGETRDRVFAKVEWGPVALEGFLNDRSKDVPTASYSTTFNQGLQTVRDRSRSLALRLQQPLRDGGSISGSIAAHGYDYNGAFPYEPQAQADWAHGRWGVAEGQYARLVAGKHRISVGGAYILNARQEQGLSYDPAQPPVFLNDTTANVYGVFAAAEIRLLPRLIFNAGLRYDHSRWLNNTWSPRAALIYTLDPGSAVKLLYGRAFRAATNYERFFNDNGVTQKSTLGVSPEGVSTVELLLEKVVSSSIKWTASVYRYEANRLIDLATDPADGLLQFSNSGRATGTGAETEVELDLRGATARASYTVQRARDAGDIRLSNSPAHLGVLTVAVPLAANRARLGLEVRAMSSRLSVVGNEVPGHVVSNLVVSTRRFARGVLASAGVFNLFDAAYGDPVGEEHVQRAIQQDGRVFRATIGYQF